MLDVFACTWSGTQNLNPSDASAKVRAWNQSLRNDVAKSLGQSRANDRFFIFRIKTNDAIDRFGRVNRVQGRKYEVAGLSRFQCNFSSFVVAHFADQNDLRRLAQGGAQGRGKVVGVVPAFALIGRRILVRVTIFDRIFDRDDVIVLGFINDVDHRCESRALAGTGGTGDEHEAISQLRDFGQLAGSVQGGERG